MTVVPKDWRGTPLNPGAVVLYSEGSSTNHSMYEAEVTGKYTPGGKARLKLLRTSIQGVYKAENLLENGDRHILALPLFCTVITEALPPTGMKTVKEFTEEEKERLKAVVEEKKRLAAEQALLAEKQAAEQAAREVFYDTHLIVPRERKNNALKEWLYPPCLMCDMKDEEMSHTICPNPQPDIY